MCLPMCLVLLSHEASRDAMQLNRDANCWTVPHKGSPWDKPRDPSGRFCCGGRELGKAFLGNYCYAQGLETELQDEYLAQWIWCCGEPSTSIAQCMQSGPSLAPKSSFPLVSTLRATRVIQSPEPLPVTWETWLGFPSCFSLA